MPSSQLKKEETNLIAGEISEEDFHMLRIHK